MQAIAFLFGQFCVTTQDNYLLLCEYLHWNGNKYEFMYELDRFLIPIEIEFFAFRMLSPTEFIAHFSPSSNWFSFVLDLENNKLKIKEVLGYANNENLYPTRFTRV